MQAGEIIAKEGKAYSLVFRQTLCELCLLFLKLFQGEKVIFITFDASIIYVDRVDGDGVQTRVTLCQVMWGWIVITCIFSSQCLMTNILSDH